MVDALIMYLLNAYPKLVSLFRSFRPVTESLMVGKGFSCFKEVEIINLFDQLARPDLHTQVFPRSLLAINPEQASTSVASHFICSQKKYSQDLKAAGSFGPTFSG